MGVLLGLILPTHAFIQPPILPKLYLQRRKRKAVDPNLEDFTAGNIVIVATWGGLEGDLVFHIGICPANMIDTLLSRDNTNMDF